MIVGFSISSFFCHLAEQSPQTVWCSYCYTYGTAQLQGNVYMRVTHKQLACILWVLARVLASSHKGTRNSEAASIKLQ